MSLNDNIAAAILTFEVTSCRRRKDESLRFLTALSKPVWNSISTRSGLSEDFLNTFQKKINWNILLKYNRYSERILERFHVRLSWSTVSKYQKNLSPEFMYRFRDRLDWSLMSQFQRIPESLIRLMAQEIDFKAVSHYQKDLTLNFIEEYSDLLCWNSLSYRQPSILQDYSFIERNADRINWFLLCKHHILSKEFIERFVLHLDWCAILTFQEYNLPFLLECICPYKKIENIDNDICAICREPDIKEHVKLKKCAHAFCESCIYTWLMSNTTCPLCRTALL